MNMKISMGELNRGQKAAVLSVDTKCSSFNRDLAILGLVPGTQIECLLKYGDISCYLIRGSRIALQNSFLNEVLVYLKED